VPRSTETARRKFYNNCQLKCCLFYAGVIVVVISAEEITTFNGYQRASLQRPKLQQLWIQRM